MVTFKIKIRPLLSHIWFKTLTSNCPKKAIKIPEELDNPWEKKRVALNSSLQLTSLDSLEWFLEGIKFPEVITYF